MKDYLGNPLKVGDYVIVPEYEGMLQVGQVVKVYDKNTSRITVEVYVDGDVVFRSDEVIVTTKALFDEKVQEHKKRMIKNTLKGGPLKEVFIGPDDEDEELEALLRDV